MVDVKSILIDLLATYEYPVRLQGSLTPSEKYPDNFFTIWNTETNDGNHYDNDAVSFTWIFTINFFSTNPALVNTILTDVRAKLKVNGWIVKGRGSDAPTDEPTHTGRALEVLYIEKNKEE